jgi:aminoglycoside N3'-acetyltransferase
MASAFKERLFRGGIRRTVRRTRNRLFRRTTEAHLARAVASLGIPPGATVCMHSMLSGLGYLVGGPAAVIGAVRSAIPDVTLVMPTFPFDGTMQEYLATDPVFDRDTTPSRSGLMTEAFRRYSGTRRGWHPTHPSAALGPRAHELIDGAEHSDTPFGPGSTYGRYAARDDAWQLLLHTNSTSIVHCFQELVNMPNLFLSEPLPARWRGPDGAIHVTRVRVHMPQIPLYVAVAGDGPDGVEYVWFPDYVLAWPEYNRARIERNLSAAARRFLLDRQREFFDRGVFRRTAVRDSELLAIAVKPWTARIRRDLEGSLAGFPDAYRLETLLRAREAGRLRA